MTFLAASAGDFVGFLFIFGLILIGWISEKLKEAKNKSATPNPTSRTGPTSTRPDRQTAAGSPLSEEERTRRFLEALGMPAPTAAPDRKQTPPPLRETTSLRETQPKPQKKARKRGGEMPVPPIITRDYRENKPYRQRQPQERPRPEPPSLDELPAPTAPAGRISVGSLPPSLAAPFHVPYQTTSSTVSAVPWDKQQQPMMLGTQAQEEARGRSAALDLLLRSPESLRTAVLLKEILGAPRSLQRLQ